MTLCDNVRHLEGEMRTLMEATLKEGVEHGAYICEKDGKYVFGGVCKGDDCVVKLEDCKGGKIVGSFHTHPPTPTSAKGADIAFSVTDLISGYHTSDITQRRSLECVGSNYIVRCAEMPEDRKARKQALKLAEDFEDIAEYSTTPDFSSFTKEDIGEALFILYRKFRDEQAKILEPCEFSVWKKE